MEKVKVERDLLERTLRETGGDVQRAADTLALPESTVRRRIKSMKINIANIRSEAYVTATPSSLPPRGTPERHNVDSLRKKVVSLEKELAAALNYREGVFELAKADHRVPSWVAGTSRKRVETPIIFSSDVQFGEVIRSEEMDGVNAYDSAIAKRRYRDFISSSIDICKNYRRADRYPGCIYLRGGDSISGNIHDELLQTNDLPASMQVAELFGEEKRGIEVLAETFGRVNVISVPGNHGRVEKKPHAKGFVQSNYDHLLTLMLEQAFSGSKEITFTHPLSGDAYFRVHGVPMLLTHGDRIGSRGGQGFVGASATIARGAKKVRDEYASYGKPIKWVWMGHFHEFMVLNGTIVNGGMPGYSEFARMNRMRPEEPSQTLAFVDSRYGLNEIRRVVLK